MLSTFNLPGKNISPDKQMSMMRTYLNQLKDEMESELYNIRWENLSKDLQDTINSLKSYSAQSDDKINAINANYVSTDYLSANYITAAQISAAYATIGQLNAVSAVINNLVAIAITTENLSAQNIDAGQITTGTLSANRIGANSITANKIASGAITADKIGANEITAAKIATNTITADRINIQSLAWAFGDFEPTIAFNNIQILESLDAMGSDNYGHWKNG